MADTPLAPEDTAPPVTIEPEPRWRADIARWLLVILAIIGAWISLDLTRQSGGLAATNPLLAKYCAADVGDCASVLSSEYGRTAGVPTAVFGLGYFLLVALWFALVGGPRTHGRLLHIPIALIVALGGLQSLQLTLVMATVLQRWCVGCAAAHIANFLIIIALAWMWVRRKPFGATTLPLAAAALIAGLATNTLCIVGTRLFIAQEQSQRITNEYVKILRDPDYVRWSHARQTGVEIPLRGTASPDQRVIVCFFDFECPVCPTASASLDAVKEEFGDRVRIEYRHYPLDAACNPAITQTRHHAACEAARAGEAARLLGGDAAFDRFRHGVYQRSVPLSPTLYLEVAQQIGLESAAFQAAMADPRVAERISADVALAQQIGVTRTPTVFLDGRTVVTDWRDAAAIWRALLGENAESATAPENQ